MTRNSRKFQKQTNPKTQNKTKAQSAKDNILSKLSFVASTEMVKLPTKGLYYPTTSPLHGVEQVEVKHMTAKEEDILSSLTAENSRELFTRIVQSILVKPDVDASLFCEQDLTAILLNARMTGFGRTFTTSEFCMGCAQVTNFEFDLAKQEVVTPKEEFVSYDCETDTFEVMLPTLEMKIKMRNLEDHHFEAISREEEKKKELGIEFNKTAAFFRETIVSVEGIDDKEIIATLIEKMPAVDSMVIKEVYSDSRPKISTMQEVECQSCGAVARKEVPASWAFFRPDKSVY